MSTGTAVAVIMSAGAAGVLVLLVAVAFVTHIRGHLPTTTDTMMILVAVCGTVLAVAMAAAPDMPAPPAGVTPTTYGPPPDVPRDLLSGEPL